MAYYLTFSTKGAINVLKMLSTNLQSRAPSSELLTHHVQTSISGTMSLITAINFYIPRIKNTFNDWRRTRSDPNGKESTCQCRRFKRHRFDPWEGNGYPLQYSCLENPMDRGAWQAIVHGAAKSWTPLKWLSTLGSNPGFLFMEAGSRKWLFKCGYPSNSGLKERQ